MDNADFLDFHNEATQQAFTVLGETFTYKGAPYTGIVSAVELSNELAEGGLMETLGTRILAARDAFTTIPKSGETLFLGNQKVRIQRVATDEITVELICVTATK